MSSSLPLPSDTVSRDWDWCLVPTPPSPSLPALSDVDPSPDSKREYLLAQIRQKDAIIESLLKQASLLSLSTQSISIPLQLHNPYTATPLSIASYRMATSPSDSSNKNVLAWLNHLQSSVKDAGGKTGSRAFKLDDRADDEGSSAGSESETLSPPGTGLTHAQRFGLVPHDEDPDPSDPSSSLGDDTESGVGSSLPDTHVPLGLIANLSLSNNPRALGKGKKGKGKGVKTEVFDSEDDDDVVSSSDLLSRSYLTDGLFNRGWRMQHTLCLVRVHGDTLLWHLSSDPDRSRDKPGHSCNVNRTT